MTTQEMLEKAMPHDWYVQSANAVPVFLEVAGWSGIVMDEELGYAYQHFIFHFKEGYGEMWYDMQDLERLWQAIKQKIAGDPAYLVKTKRRYEEIIATDQKLFARINDLDLNKVSNNKLLTLLRQARLAMTNVVGIAHICEPIGLMIEKELKETLSQKIGTEKFMENFVMLTAPSSPSFIAREETELRAIDELPKEEKAVALRKHCQKYRWLQNTYREPQKVNLKFLRERLQALRQENQNERVDVTERKRALVDQLKLSAEVHQMLEIIDFTTIWQDQRKENVLNTIGYVGIVVAELAKRTKVPVNDMYYLDVSDIENTRSLVDIKNLAPELAQRRAGSYFLMKDKQEFVASGELYQVLSEKRAQTATAVAGKQIYGSVANTGTAFGKVALCLNLSSLHKVQKGDILVTSMTRPEFMPALKKAAAIITDEGGITSHAAIVSRELGIPAIIGTKVATKILKDGMNVEVRANHGFVKIISQ